MRFSAIYLLFIFVIPMLTAQELRIGIIGDQTLAPADTDPYDVLKRGVAALKARQVDVVLHTGDLLESIGPDWGPAKPELYKARYEEAVSILNGLGHKWYLSAGDHDVNPPYLTTDFSVRHLFQRLYQPAAAHLYYSFDVKGYHFIALSSQEEETPNADPRWGVVFRSHLSRKQVDWLKEDLAQHSRSRGIIVFLHQPLWYQWGDWAPVHALLRRSKVIAVVAGHFHYNQDEKELDGIRYAVVGATGGVTKAGSPNAGNLHHVTVMHIAGRQVTELLLLPLRNEPVHHFSSRRDMDRVQALDLDLSNSFNDTAQDLNRIKQKPGATQWISCVGQGNGSLALNSIGNPLDVPVTIQVEANPGNLLPTSTHFNPAACKESQPNRCTLDPGALIAISNNSVVQPAFQYCGTSICNHSAPQPLWSAQFPAQTSDGQPVSQSFTIKATFYGEAGQQLEVDKVFSVSASCCSQ